MEDCKLFPLSFCKSQLEKIRVFPMYFLKLTVKGDFFQMTGIETLLLISPAKKLWLLYIKQIYKDSERCREEGRPGKELRNQRKIQC